MFAAFYERIEPRMEGSGLRRLRAGLLRQASGRVLDVGGGIGANLDLWPAAVSSVTICEPDSAMRRRLEDRVAFRAPSSVPVEVHPQGVPGLPFPDASFDTIVCTLVLCTVEDLDGSIAELRRLLTPDGKLLLLEHVLVSGVAGRVQQVATPVWRRLMGGCRLDRDTVAAVRAGGFAMADCERPPLMGGRLAGTIVVGSAIRTVPA